VAEAKAVRAAGLPEVSVGGQKRVASSSIGAKIKAYNERQNGKREG
jgi:hypothetical protein